MTFEFSTNSLDRISADGIAVFVFEGKKNFVPTEWFSYLDKLLGNLLSEIINSEGFEPKVGNFLTVYNQKILAKKVYVVGLGKKEDFSLNVLRRAVAIFTKSIKNKVHSITLSKLSTSELREDLQLQSKVLAEGFLLGSYVFNKYKTKEEGKKFLETVIFSEGNKFTQVKMKNGVKRAEIYSQATKIARDLVNDQASIVNPTLLANMARDIAKDNKDVSCTVYDKAQIEKMGMNAFLGVAQASDTPPKFIHLEYKGRNPKRKLAIVGKGITFDTGGVSIKRDESMMTMKLDMAGAADVLGIFSVISQIKPSFSVMGIIAATPNMISGKSLVPGDVLRAMNGKTIEVLSTDAEGRITLADALSYAVQKGATEIIDLATLTGACMVALGPDIAGIMGNERTFLEKVKKSASDAGEKVWELPLDPEYKKLNKSEVADISNIPSTRYGGAITGGLFLEEFVDNKPWVHMDLAGTAFAEKKYDLGPKGGTGFGVATLLNFLSEQ